MWWKIQIRHFFWWFLKRFLNHFADLFRFISIFRPFALLCKNQNSWHKFKIAKALFKSLFQGYREGYKSLTMRISHDRSASFWASTTKHKTSKVQKRFVICFALVLCLCQLLFEIFINEEMNHCFADSPIRSCHAFPKSSDTLQKKVDFARLKKQKYDLHRPWNVLKMDPNALTDTKAQGHHAIYLRGRFTSWTSCYVLK